MLIVTQNVKCTKFASRENKTSTNSVYCMSDKAQTQQKKKDSHQSIQSFFQSKEETPSNLRTIYIMPCIALIPYKCCWCIYLAFCCLHNKASHQWQHRASSQKSFHSVDGSAAHRGSLFSEREAVTKCWRENRNLKKQKQQRLTQI